MIDEGTSLAISNLISTLCLAYFVYKQRTTMNQYRCEVSWLSRELEITQKRFRREMDEHDAEHETLFEISQGVSIC